MLAAAGAPITNIGLLAVIIATYIQNARLIKSYFTYGLVPRCFAVHSSKYCNSYLLVKFVYGGSRYKGHC